MTHVNEDGQEILDGLLETMNGVADGLDFGDMSIFPALYKAYDNFGEGLESLQVAWDTPEGHAEIVQYVEDKLNFPNKVAERRAEIVLEQAGNFYQGVTDWIAAGQLE